MKKDTEAPLADPFDNFETGSLGVFFCLLTSVFITGLAVGILLAISVL